MKEFIAKHAIGKPVSGTALVAHDGFSARYDLDPEHTLGAYEFATGVSRRTDGRGADDGETFFVLGVDHPYAVISKDTPSLLPEGAIAVRFHSIGGWGMITTGKNLGSIVGDFGKFISEAHPTYDEDGTLEDKLFVMANPKYGSEKKGAPTNYYLTVAPSQIKVNCELNHVDVVLCCDPKAFTHTNPLEGLKRGGSLVWESGESPEVAWQRIPAHHRKFVIDHNIRVFILPGFDIARKATDQVELQLRMQGNAFLGAFFKVSPFLTTFDISEEQFHDVVRKQYVKKFARFGDAVVESNMAVMEAGFDQVREIAIGREDDTDSSSMRNPLLAPIGDHHFPPTAGCGSCGSGGLAMPVTQLARAPLQTMAKFDSEFRAGLGYHQPSSALASVGIMSAGTGATQSKYVARRETPVYIAENCTQCMECITACPDTALPNMAQDVTTVLKTAVNNYVSDVADRRAFGTELPALEQRARAKGGRFLLLKRSTKVRGKARAKLNAVLASLGATSRAWELKESFRRFWLYRSPTWAAAYLRAWTSRAMRSKLEPMKKVARMLRAHEELLLNYFRAKRQYNSGVVEGLNNKARVSLAHGYGHRSSKILELVLYHALGKLPEPPSTHKFC